MRAYFAAVCGAVGLSMVTILGCGAPVDNTGADTGAAQRARVCDVEVYALRGLWDVFSLGLDTLTDKLHAQNIDAVAASDTQWSRVAEEIRSTHGESGDGGSIVLVGHSYGADDAIRVAKRLESAKLSVALLVLVDATNPPPVPANVDRVVHYYLPTTLGEDDPDGFPGNPVVLEPGNKHTQMENIIFSEENFGPRVAGVDHFSIDESPVLHQLVIDAAKELCAGTRSGADEITK